MLRSKKFYWRVFSIITFICLWSIPNAQAFDLEISLGGGYDNNPYLEKGSEGALFAQTELNGWQDLSLGSYPATTITLSGFAAYRQYDGLDDNWQLGGGIETSTQLSWLPCTLEFFNGAAAHRNPLVDDSDFDNLELGGRLAGLVGSRLSLEFECGISWEDYRQSVATPINNKTGNSKNGTDESHNENSGNDHQEELDIAHDASKSGQPKHHNSGERSDRLITTAVKAFYAFNPYLEGGSELYWRHRHSSIDAERRATYGLSVNLNWHPVPNLEFVWLLSAERVPYRYDYKKEERTEKIYSSEIAVSWRRGNWTVSGAWNWSKRDSLVNEDDYQRNQWQSRLTYSY